MAVTMRKVSVKVGEDFVSIETADEYLTINVNGATFTYTGNYYFARTQASFENVINALKEAVECL